MESRSHLPPVAQTLIDTVLEIPPFGVRVRSPLSQVDAHCDFFYRHAVQPSSTIDRFIDFDVQIEPGRGLRRFWNRQARFVLNGIEPFHPLPGSQAGPLLEWGLNWAIAQGALGYLVMHAAVVAVDNAALMLPGHPGSGKSTLCATLVLQQGWRLLSDELAILDPTSGDLIPHPRPINLKNRSIDLVRSIDGAVLGPLYPDTRKGTVAHARVPPASLARAREPARVKWLVFPRFEADAQGRCEEIGRAEAFALLAEQSFNRERMGRIGFDAVCALLGDVRCFEIRYPDTRTSIELINLVRSA